MLKHITSTWNRYNRNNINNAIDVLNQQGKSLQDLVAEGQLTEEQYAELLTTINGLVKSGNVDKSDLTPEFKDEIEGFDTQLAQKVGGGNLASMADLSQEVKEAMTGGSVAVVGEGAVATINLASDLKNSLIHPIKNELTNGNFVNDTGWTPTSSTNVISGNTLTNTGAGSTPSAGVFNSTEVPISTGKRLYFKARVRVTTEGALSIRLRFGGTVNAAVATVSEVSSPLINQWYDLSGIVVAGSQTGNARVYVFHDYADGASASGKVMEVQYTAMVDVDKVFGDYDVTKEELDDIFLRYPNKWFDGEVNLFNARDIFQKTLQANSLEEFMTESNQGWVV